MWKEHFKFLLMSNNHKAPGSNEILQASSKMMYAKFMHVFFFFDKCMLTNCIDPNQLAKNQSIIQPNPNPGCDLLLTSCYLGISLHSIVMKVF